MNVLIACERSGIIREAFRSRGHDAWSCDLEPSEDDSPFHYKFSVFELFSGSVAFSFKLENCLPEWDLLIAHPPCQYLSSSGLHWNNRISGREDKTSEALAFALRLWALPVKRKCLENPIGRLTSYMRNWQQSRPVIQIVQPYQFGHDASKATCLILDCLPLLTHTKYVYPRIVNGKERWANQTNSGQNRLGPSPTRSMDRARTYSGIADAMAEQWGRL